MTYLSYKCSVCQYLWEMAAYTGWYFPNPPCPLTCSGTGTLIEIRSSK